MASWMITTCDFEYILKNTLGIFVLANILYLFISVQSNSQEFNSCEQLEVVRIPL